MNNYIYHGTQNLIALPGRSVQTFPSGLVRVDRTYACRKTLADRYRQDLRVGSILPFDNGVPAIDGLFIFPEPQERVRDDGFVEFRVSAYGRANTTGSEQISDQYFTQSRLINNALFSTPTGQILIVGNITVRAVFRSKLLIKEIVLLQGETVDPTTDSIPQAPELIFDGGTGEGFAAGERGIYSVGIQNYTSRNFGRISEVSVTYGPILVLSN